MRKFVSWKRKLSVVLAVCMLQLFGMHLFVSSAAAADANAIPDLQAKSAILMEANTGQVLYENNADTLLPPASMSKMMTEYLIMEAIKDGKIKWEDKVPVSKQAASAIGSGQLLAEGEQLSVKDMFYAISIYSSNDASVAMAEYLGGTEEEFANMMNKKLKNWDYPKVPIL
ncbi:serine hydrolase [Paenibacillus larvae]|nr:serine hydrolase [Paenibacillus larvae]MDT2256838.1 serine hydrolase [Paenibacillus larvae]MDT2259211.1 serine hydrolase [Paenibacillus larvae]